MRARGLWPHEVRHDRDFGLAFAHVDCPDDVWRWCIVTGYAEAQDFGYILMAFADGYTPDIDTVVHLLDYLWVCRE